MSGNVATGKSGGEQTPCFISPNFFASLGGVRGHIGLNFNLPRSSGEGTAFARLLGYDSWTHFSQGDLDSDEIKSAAMLAAALVADEGSPHVLRFLVRPPSDDGDALEDVLEVLQTVRRLGSSPAYVNMTGCFFEKGGRFVLQSNRGGHVPPPFILPSNSALEGGASNEDDHIVEFDDSDYDNLNVVADEMGLDTFEDVMDYFAEEVAEEDFLASQEWSENFDFSALPILQNDLNDLNDKFREENSIDMTSEVQTAIFQSITHESPSDDATDSSHVEVEDVFSV